MKEPWEDCPGYFKISKINVSTDPKVTLSKEECAEQEKCSFTEHEITSEAEGYPNSRQS